MEFVILIAVVALLTWAVVTPLRRERVAAESPPPVRDLEAAREAKYREIRDAELDLRTGKLSEEDWGELDAGLRAEAVGLLHRLDEANGG